MKKLMSALAFAGALTFAGLMPSAEALVPYQGPDGNCLVFAESLSDASGYAMKSYPNLCYIGKWQRQPNGKIIIVFDKEYVKDDSGKVIGNSKVNLPYFVSMNQNELLVTTSENSAEPPQSYFRAEYAWGNDKLMASYMLVDYLKAQGSFAGKVAIVGSRANTLNAEMQAMVNRNEQNATGTGHWLKVTRNDSVKYYYVESDPRVIYEQVGNSLTLLDRD